MREERRFLAFSGLRVHFALCWPEEAIKHRLMMLSSPLINTFHWRKLVPELTDLGCLCVSVDLPGFGLSDPRAPQSVTQRSNMLWGVLDDIDQAGECPLSMWHLMAHGTACGTILRMAAQYPDSVKSQIHLCPTFSTDIDSGEVWYDENVRDAAAFRRTIERWAGYPLDDYILDRMRRPLLRPGMRQTFGRMVRYAVTPGQGMGFCPTMALMGGRDPLMSPQAKGDISALLSEAESHTIQSAGHFPMETHSRALRDYLRGWMKYNE